MKEWLFVLDRMWYEEIVLLLWLNSRDRSC